MKKYLKSEILNVSVNAKIKLDEDYLILDKRIMKLAGIDEYELVEIFNLSRGSIFKAIAIADDKEGFCSVRSLNAGIVSVGDNLSVRSFVNSYSAVTPLRIKLDEVNRLQEFLPLEFTALK